MISFMHVWCLCVCVDCLWAIIIVAPLHPHMQMHRDENVRQFLCLQNKTETWCKLMDWKPVEHIYNDSLLGIGSDFSVLFRPAIASSAN